MTYTCMYIFYINICIDRYHSSERARKMGQWIKDLLYKPEDLNLDPKKLC